MYENSVCDYSATCASLATKIQDCEYRIRITKSNELLRDKFTKEIQSSNYAVQACDYVLELLRPLVKETQEYINTRKRETLQNIQNAIRLASEIVPDAMIGTQLVIDKEEAYLVTSDGLDVQRTEGGGYRTILSTFLRSVILRANPDLLQVLFLDEAFSTLSVRHSAVLSTYLNLLGNTQQIISIEQKPEVYSNTKKTSYIFEKGEEYSVVTKVTEDN